MRLLTASMLLAAAGMAAAQSFPAKPLRMIVPYAPGGSVDTLARLVAPRMAEGLGQPIVVDNRAGAGGAIGVDATAKAPADGYTIVATGSGSVTVNVHLSKLPYDPVRDLAPVSMLVTLPMIVGTHPGMPVQSVRELVAHVKAKPGSVSYASNGIGSLAFLAGELFKRMAGIDMVHVPYKGAAPASAALAAGEVQVGFIDSAAVLPLARSGRIRPIAVTDPKRSALVPEVPTVAESGVAGYGASGWAGLFAPAGTPREVVARLNHEVVRALQSTEVRERVLAAAMEAAPSTADELAKTVREEIERWGELVKSAKIKLD